MNMKINDSINYLISELKRLQLKDREKKIYKEEKETLKKLESFMDKKDD